MSKSKIEWTTATWNFSTGCTHYSPECANCYAEVLTKRLAKLQPQKYGKGFSEVVTHEASLSNPYNWKKGQVVFVNSMSDTFHKDIPQEFRHKAFKVMNETPRHVYQVLTKRDNILKEEQDSIEWSDNIWMGISVGSKASVRKIDVLRNSKAKHKFLSVEPLIEDLGSDLNLEGIHWVIVGGESGRSKGIRKMELGWVMNIKEACDRQNIPFFFKQWGHKSFNPNPFDPTIQKDHQDYAKGGCQLNGIIYHANPCFDQLRNMNNFNAKVA